MRRSEIAMEIVDVEDDIKTLEEAQAIIESLQDENESIVTLDSALDELRTDLARLLHLKMQLPHGGNA